MRILTWHCDRGRGYFLRILGGNLESSCLRIKLLKGQESLFCSRSQPKMSNGYSCTINKKMLVILILRNKFYGDPSRILYPTMGSPLLGQILPIRDGISPNKKESSLPVRVIFGHFENRVILSSFSLEQISVGSKSCKIIHLTQLRHTKVNTLLLNDPFKGV